MSLHQAAGYLQSHVESFGDNLTEYEAGRKSAFEVALKYVEKCIAERDERPVAPVFASRDFESWD